MAMSAGGGNPGEVSSEINVTPMIDVLLVLLIIFMITQPLSRMAMDVQVPPPDTPQTNQQPSFQIVLELRDDGSYAINTQVYPKDQLDAQLHAIYDARPAKLMFVKAGPNRIYQDVIEAMDIARGAGHRPAAKIQGPLDAGLFLSVSATESDDTTMSTPVDPPRRDPLAFFEAQFARQADPEAHAPPRSGASVRRIAACSSVWSSPAAIMLKPNAR